VSDRRLLAELAELAHAVAAQAAALLTRPGADLAVSTKTSPTDVVTAMDTAAERLIRRLLAQARPDDAVVGEEGRDHAGSSGVRWVVDPIDGTVNYLYGLPGWSVSVGAQVDGVPAVGVVVVPGWSETFAAVAGQGATCNGERLAVRAAVPLAEALVATGFGYASSRRAAQAGVLASLLPAVRDIRRAGAASVDLCSVAAGRLDAYYERGLQPWDHAAGALVAREAGARVGGLRGAAEGADMLVAAPPGLFEPLADLLAELGADTGD